MTPPDFPNANRPLPDSEVVRTRRDGSGVSIDKSVVEAALDECDHGLVPDTAEHYASDDLLRTLAEAFADVPPEMPHDVVTDQLEAARAIRTLHDEAIPVCVTRRRR